MNPGALTLVLSLFLSPATVTTPADTSLPGQPGAAIAAATPHLDFSDTDARIAISHRQFDFGTITPDVLTVAQGANAPAARQMSSGVAPVDISVGYHFYHETGLNAPVGFAFGVNSTSRVGVAGEVDATFKSVSGVSVTLWDFLGGVRFTGSGQGQRGYVQVLAGKTTASAGVTGTTLSVTDSGFTIAPGGGVDIIRPSSKVGLRVQAALLLIHADGGWGKAITFNVGVVFGAGK